MRVPACACACFVCVQDTSSDGANELFFNNLCREPQTLSSFAPQCGVSPGFMAVVGARMVEQFDQV